MSRDGAHYVDLVIFGLCMIANIGLGLYFALFNHSRKVTTSELFLGSRSMNVIPLALSYMASCLSALGIIGFSAHYYAYGYHSVWLTVPAIGSLAFLPDIIIPVLFRLRVTSVFEYLRLRFGNHFGITACGIYLLFTNCGGAVSIFAASVAASTVFKLPLLWTSIAIGLTGTMYTALGGLRGVVWTDCFQAVLIILSPVTVISKVVFDSTNKNITLRPLWDIKAKSYYLDTTLDFTKDENLWASLIGLFSFSMYRCYMDQIAAQRYLAAKTIQDAKRIVCLGTLLTNLGYMLICLIGISLTYWFRDCDPQLTGEIGRPDQILPFYVSVYLKDFPGFPGIFLAGVVGATTSTVSSLINSQATICYVDIVSVFANLPERRAANLTKLLAFVSGVLMTILAVVVPNFGSVATLMMLLWNALSGPLIGVFLLALLFPCADRKGTSAATIMTIVFQMWLTLGKVHRGIRPARMEASTTKCTEYFTSAISLVNQTSLKITEATDFEPAGLYRLSAYWSGMITTLATIALGLIFSRIGGEHRNYRTHLFLTSIQALRLWRRLRLITESDLKLHENPKNGYNIEHNIPENNTLMEPELPSDNLQNYARPLLLKTPALQNASSQISV